MFKSNTIISQKNALINYNAGNLPDEKGRNIINWPIINNLKEFGIKILFVNEEIDTGDIILQKLIAIKDDDYNDLL